MDLKQMEYFVTVAEELSYTRAAERLYISQPTLSRRIRELEEELGFRLLERNTKRVALTPEGEYFQKSARQLLQYSENMVSVAREIHNGKIGHLSVGYQNSALGVIPFILNSMRENCPHVEINLTNTGAYDLFQRLNNGNYDVVFAFDAARTMGQTDHILLSWTLFEDNMALFTDRRTYEEVISVNPRPRLADFQGRTFLQIDRITNPSYYNVLHNIYLSRDFYPERIFECSELEALHLYLEGGAGVSLLPETSTLEYNHHILPIELADVQFKLPIKVYWLKDNDNPCLRSFTELLRRLIDENQLEKLRQDILHGAWHPEKTAPSI